MKNKFLLFAAFTALLFSPKLNFGQTLGSTANFVLFSTNGPLNVISASTFTGDIGTNNGTCSGFTGVTGVVHTMDAATALCATDLLTLYNQLNNTAATLIPVPILGNGQVLTAGAYSISTAASLNATLTLDAQSNPGAKFIIQVQGAFSTNAGAVVNLINGALACNVFWKIEGAFNTGAGTLMKGTVVVNNALISLGAGTILQGRALATAGAVDVNGVTLYISTCSNPSPTITTQPTNQTACLGSSVSYSVSATGAGLTYQWRKGLVNLVNGGSISGATSAILTITGISLPDAGSDYNVMVNGTYLPGVISINASLIIGTAPAITVQSPNQTICAGSSVNFPITATGLGLTYQWRKALVNLSNGGTISGATSAILTINPVNVADAAINYNVVVSGSCGPAVTSSNISLVVNSAPAITSQPVSQSVCAGASVNFPVIASGPGLTYQWRKGIVNISNGGTISGATTANLNISAVTALDASANYNVVVSGSCLPNAVSINVSLVVDTPPVIVSQPVSQTVCVGTTVNFPVTCTGSGLTYQWRLGTVNLNNGGNISGATSSQLTLNSVTLADAALNYNVVITGLCTPVVISGNTSLGINTAPAILAQPVTQTICSGSPVNFMVTTTGSGLSYQWRKGLVNVTNGGTTSGATNSVLTISSVVAADAAANYNVVITGLCSPIQVSSNVGLVVNIAPSILTQPVSQTICAGGTVIFSVSTAGTDLSYQWRKGTVNITNGNNISGANSAVLTINPAGTSDVASNYNVVVHGHCAPNQISANTALTINTSPVVAMLPGIQKVCVGGSVSFPVTVTGSGLTYQWRRGTVNLVNGGNISGANAVVLTISPASTSDAGSDYNLVITGLCAPSVTTANMQLIVKTAPVITLQPNNQMGYPGSSVSLYVMATGSELTYQWRRGTVNLVNGGNISGATSSILTINPVNVSDTASNYNVVITGACSPAVVSNNAIFWVCVCVEPTALKEENSVGSVKVFPNPFSNAINITVTKESLMNTCEMKIYNVSGIEVMHSTVTKEITQLDTSSLAPGAYFYRILFEDKMIQTGKLISQ